jgi:hypothetical protein
MHPANMMLDLPRQVEIFFKDKAGEARVCRIIPHSIEFNRYRDIEEWLLIATDVALNESTKFPMRSITKWVPII